MFIALSIFAFLSLLLLLWQWVAALRFPVHRRVSETDFTPSVTLLKPLKGLDENTMDCLRSWMEQDYAGSVQVLFGVASQEDPVCELVRRLIAEFPKADAQLVLCQENLGVNRKVSSLIQLQRQAKHEVVIVSDGDVRVTRDFLRNAVAPLRDAEVGLVNCFYRIANPVTTAMRWEALAVNGDFWSQVLQGYDLAPLDFALGAVMITRRAELAKIGGFEGVADHLADDFQLGNRVARIAKKRIALCPVVVDCLSGPMNWREAWAHQLRWARTIRVSKPLPYAFSILSNATLWPLIWAVVFPCKLSLLTLTGCLVVRMISAQALQTRLGAVPGQAKYFWLAPVKDLLQFALWVGAFLGNHVIWRGQRFRVHRDGRLVKV